MNAVHALETSLRRRKSDLSLGAEVAETTDVAGLARLLMQEGIEAPRQFFSRINGTLVRPGGKRISHRVERTATEILYFLFRCHIAGKNPSVSEVYLATGLARGTTIRCIAGLRELGILETSTDTRDRRRSRVRFADAYQHLTAEFSDVHCQQLAEQLSASGFVHVGIRVA
ncbi:MAG: hypothetical protein AAB223_00380 [Pseudomonadota bacterium]